jgi:hypothetical protein
VHLGLDVDIDDLVALEGGDDGAPGHLGNAHGSAVAVGEDGDGEGDAVAVYAAELISEDCLSKVEGLLVGKDTY